MFKFLKEKKKDNKGFTLVELVIVIAILAILVGLLAPQYTKYVEKSRKSADASNMDEMVKAVQVYAADGTKNVPVVTNATIVLGDSVVISDDNLKKAVEEYLNRSPSSRQLKKYKFFLPVEIYLLAVLCSLQVNFVFFHWC